MKLVITGAAGHLGSHLIGALGGRGDELIGIDRVVSASPVAGVSYVQADLAQAGAVKDALRGADLVAHCAAVHPWKPYTDDQYLDANIKGTWHLYAAAAEVGVRRIVLTSSIAATGYGIPPGAWPVPEDAQYYLMDLYSYTKLAQENTARLFAASGKVQTVALRPPAFMPKPPLETGFSLTGAYALVEDVVSAHVAAIETSLGLRQPSAPLAPFEAFFVTTQLPYVSAEAALFGPNGDMKPLVRTHWPEAYDWLIARGYPGGWLPAVYDIGKARRLLGWEPRHHFADWWARQRLAIP